MIRKISVIFLLVFTWYGLYSQGFDPLIKERTEFVQDNLNDTSSWIPTTRRFYAYNSKRSPSYRNYQIWDRNREKWKMITEYNYEYDKTGNRTHDHIIRFNGDGELIRRMNIHREFQRTLETNSLLEFEDFEQDRWETHWYRREYDQEDRQIFYSMEYKDSNFTQWVHQEFDFYDDNGCKYIEVESEENIFLESSSTSKDSIVTKFDDDCRILEKNYYQMSIFQPDYVKYYQLRVERSFDDNNLVESELYHERSSSTNGWNLFCYVEFEYDPQGRPIKETNLDFNNGSGNREFKKYNRMDKVVFEQNQNWDRDNSTWQNQYIYEAEYLADTILVYYIYRYQWDPDQEKYQKFFSQTSEYDANQYLVRKIESQQGLNNENLEDFHISAEWLYNNRCDGNATSWTIQIIENENAPDQIPAEKTTVEYYENAPCDFSANSEKSLHIYPNPSRGDINIYNSEAFGESEIAILNQQGQVVFQSTQFLNNYFSIDLSDLPSGIYFIRIKNENVETSDRFLLLN